MTSRTVLRISGADNRSFLQGLISNDVNRIDSELVYAALLTPQGKYIADFFVFAQGDDVMLDTAQGDAVAARLSMYKLRADVQIAATELHVHRGLGATPEDGLADPRHAKLGWRAYRDDPQSETSVDWTALEVTYVIPDTGVELTPDTFILEAGFERLNGVDFRKGCYVGQEVTARMKHKTELRKGLAQVQISGAADIGTAITANGKPVGTLYRQSGDKALAYLRFDRAQGPMQAGDATLVRLEHGK